MTDCRLVPLSAAGYICTACRRTLPVLARRRCTAPHLVPPAETPAGSATAETAGEGLDQPRSLEAALMAKLAMGLAEVDGLALAVRLDRCRACPRHDLAAGACRDVRATCGCPATERTARLLASLDGCPRLDPPALKSKMLRRM